MLSPLLESLVLSNQATIKTHNHGIGGVGTINVPAGKKIIVTQIIWNPFVDVADVDRLKELIFQQSGSFLHTLKMRNKQTRFAYTFRDTFTPYTFKPATGDIRALVAPAPIQIIDTYLPFNEGNIEIDIMKFNNFDRWLNFPTYVPATTVEPMPGEGYGNINSAIRYQTIGSTNFYGFVPPPFLPTGYAPLGTRGLITNNSTSFEFEGTEPITMPGNNQANDDLCMFPIVTFTYVEINNRYIPGTVGDVKPFNKK